MSNQSVNSNAPGDAVVGGNIVADNNATRSSNASQKSLADGEIFYHKKTIIYESTCLKRQLGSTLDGVRTWELNGGAEYGGKLYGELEHFENIVDRVFRRHSRLLRLENNDKAADKLDQYKEQKKAEIAYVKDLLESAAQTDVHLQQAMQDALNRTLGEGLAGGPARSSTPAPPAAGSSANKGRRNSSRSRSPNLTGQSLLNASAQPPPNHPAPPVGQQQHVPPQGRGQPLPVVRPPGQARHPAPRGRSRGGSLGRIGNALQRMAGYPQQQQQPQQPQLNATAGSHQSRGSRNNSRTRNRPGRPAQSLPSSPNRLGAATGDLFREITGAVRVLADLQSQQQRTQQRRDQGNQVDADEDFYASLPGAWSGPRREPDRQTFDYHKYLQSGHVKQFSGKPEDYTSWKIQFISSVHGRKFNFVDKALLLQNSLNQNDANLKRLLRGYTPTEGSYARVIRELEKHFGGKDRQLNVLLSQLEKLQGVAKENVAAMEEMVSLLDVYREVCRESGEERAFNNRLLTRSVLDLLAPKTRDAFMEDAYEKQREVDMTGLCLWARQQIDWRLKSKHWERSSNLHAAKAGIPQKPAQKADAAITAGKPPAQNNRWKPNKPLNTFSTACYTDQDFTDQLSDEEEEIELEAATACATCTEVSQLPACSVILAMAPQKRREFLAGEKRCFICLEKGHVVRHCSSEIRCSDCGKKHHTLLHGSQPLRPRQRAEAPATPATPAATTAPVPRVESSTNVCSATSEQIALRTLPVLVGCGKQGQEIRVNCFMDDGSTVPYISERLYKALKLRGTPAHLTITGVNDLVTEVDARKTYVRLRSEDGLVTRDIMVYTMPRPASSVKCVDWNEKKHAFNHLKDIDFPKPADGPVDVMLGNRESDLMAALLPDITGEPGMPTARCTPFGWTVTGPTRPLTGVPRIIGVSHHAHAAPDAAKGEGDGWHSDDEALEPVQVYGETYFTFAEKPVEADESDSDEVSNAKLLEALQARWAYEDDPKDEELALSPEEERAVQIAKAGRRKKEGRYEMPVLWNGDPSVLPNNRHVAVRRLQKLKGHKSLKGDGWKEYGAVFKDWESKEYIERVPLGSGKFFLPHFPVERTLATTTKRRPVFDAKDKRAGMAINDLILPGPNLIADLRKVLLRFERHPYALGADVSQMYLQIHLRPEDQLYHHFLWYDEEDREIEFRFKRFPFGNRCAPYIALAAVRMHAEEYLKDPRFVETVVASTLMDDTLDSFETPQQAEQAAQQLTLMYADMGMQLRKFISNDETVLKAIPEADRAPRLALGELDRANAETLTKVLGVVYSAVDDKYTLRVKDCPSEQAWTKRKLLSVAAGVFDPQGKVCPVLIVPMMLFQQLCRQQLGWDDPLPQKECEEWKQWVKDLPRLQELTFDRCMVQVGREEVQRRLHVFCDASERGYGAAVYLVCTYDEPPKTSRLVYAKARLAKLKYESIPRIELRGAVTAIDLAVCVSQSLQMDASLITYHTDSKTVLQWLTNEKKKLRVFVANRVAYIRKHSAVSQWRWVDTLNNPADCPSRGLGADELVERELFWKHGPDFLFKEDVSPPEQPVLRGPLETAAAEEVVGEPNTQLTAKLAEAYLPAWPIERWSSLQKAKRVITICRRWLCMHKAKKLGAAAREEACDTDQAALVLLLRQEQARHGGGAVEQLRKEGRLNANHAWAKLRPELDADGLLRVGSRQPGYAPILLPRDSHLTTLVLRDLHEKDLQHASGADQLWCSVTSRYWIPRGRRLARRFVEKCITCKRSRPRPLAKRLDPAPLPTFRAPQLNRSRPFEATGVDAAGPFEVKLGRGMKRASRWIILFTCAQVRAVHLEPVWSLSADCFLKAFGRFTARRGMPKLMSSDNGGNFTAGAAAIRELLQVLNDNRERFERKHPAVVWRFNAPLNPASGGFFERLVQEAKKALEHTWAHHGPLNDEDFNTGVVLAEGILNARPIGLISSDPMDARPLTPAHFLSTGPVSALLPVAQQKMALGFRWTALTQLLDQFWETWVQRMRPYLLERNLGRRHGGAQDLLKEGALVVMLDRKLRGRWPLGRVVQVCPGSSGSANRICHVKCDGHIYKCAANLLMVLEDPEAASAPASPSF